MISYGLQSTDFVRLQDRKIIENVLLIGLQQLMIHGVVVLFLKICSNGKFKLFDKNVFKVRNIILFVK